MEQWCTLLWAILGTLAVVVSTIVSWLLDNVTGLSAWWERLPAFIKALLYAVVTIAVGGGCWALGRYVLLCGGWPGDMDIWYMIAVAVASWFAGGKRHEAQKRAG